MVGLAVVASTMKDAMKRFGEFPQDRGFKHWMLDAVCKGARQQAGTR